MLSFEQIRVIQAVHREGGLHKAAQALERSQPSVSVTLRRAEEELGFQVFDREAYRLSLTEEGMRLMAEIEEVISAMGGLQTTIDFLNKDMDPELRVAMDPLIERKALKEITQAATSAPLRPLLQITEEPLGGPYRCLINGQCDLSLGSLPAILDPEVEVLPLAVRIWRGYVLIGQNYKRLPQVKLEGRELRQSQFSDGVLWVHSYQTKREMIQWGCAWGTLIEEDAEGLETLPNVPVAEMPVFAMRMRSQKNRPMLDHIWQSLNTKGENINHVSDSGLENKIL